MTDWLEEVEARWADGTLGYADHAALGAAAAGKADVDRLVGEVKRLQRFEAMWEDCRAHRDRAEQRARRLQTQLQQVEAIVCPEEEPL